MRTAVHRTAFYPGSFDPPTNGHADVLEAALALADRVVVGIGRHPTKPGFLPHDERVAVLREILSEILRGMAADDAERVSVVAFEGLVVDAARGHGATILVRGLRDGTDLDYEMQMSGMNAAMAPGVRTVFVPAAPATRHITATLVRQIHAMGGDVSPFVPGATLAALARHAT